MSKPLTKTQTKNLNSELSSQLNVNKVLTFLLLDVEDPINVGAMFRTADGCGASLVLTGKTPTPPNNALGMTARGLDRTVEWEYHKDATEVIEKLRSKGFQIVGVEVTKDAVLYSTFDYSDKVCLVLGNEARGIYKKYLEMMDACVFLPMLGKGPSLNVHVAGSVVGYGVVCS